MAGTGLVFSGKQKFFKLWKKPFDCLGVSTGVSSAFRVLWNVAVALVLVAVLVGGLLVGGLLVRLLFLVLRLVAGRSLSTLTLFDSFKFVCKRLSRSCAGCLVAPSVDMSVNCKHFNVFNI